jgi:hypothetical protein
MAKPNPKVIALSLLGLVFIYLTFTINWLFIAGAAITTLWGWKELMKN